MSVTHVYIARNPCGCLTGFCTDIPGSKETASDVANFIKSGRTVERVLVEEARGMRYGCKCAKEQPTHA